VILPYRLRQHISQKFFDFSFSADESSFFLTISTGGVKEVLAPIRTNTHIGIAWSTIDVRREFNDVRDSLSR